MQQGKVNTVVKVQVKKRWGSVSFSHSLRYSHETSSGTYREEAQDRCTGRLQGTNDTSTTVCSTQRFSSAASPLRLCSGMGEMGLGGRPN
jgi:hypothetical protein